MKVIENPPEIKNELNEGDQSDSLLNEMDEDNYKVQVGINERIRQAQIWPLYKNIRRFLLSRLYSSVVIHFRLQIDDTSTKRLQFHL